MPSYTGGSVPLSIEPPLLESLRALARREQTTLFTVLLLAWSTLLARESGQSEVVVGTPVSGRTRPEWATIIGCFVNTLPLRVRVDAWQPLEPQLPSVIETVRGALDHQDLPFSCMVNLLKVSRSATHSPLYQTMLNVVRVPRTAGFEDLFLADHTGGIPFGNSRMRTLPLAQQQGQFDWSLELAEFEESMEGNLKYSDDVGTLDDAVRLARLLLSLLAEMIPGRDEREELAI